MIEELTLGIVSTCLPETDDSQISTDPFLSIQSSLLAVTLALLTRAVDLRCDRVDIGL